MTAFLLSITRDKIIDQGHFPILCRPLYYCGHLIRAFLLSMNENWHESSQICPFLAERTQFDSDHHQHRRLSSHSYSHKSVIFIFYSYLLSYGEFAFFEFKCTRLRYATLRLHPLKTSTAGAGQSIRLR